MYCHTPNRMSTPSLECTKTENIGGSGSAHEEESVLSIIPSLSDDGYASIGSDTTVNLHAIILHSFDDVDDANGYLKEEENPSPLPFQCNIKNYKTWLPGDNTYPKVEANAADCGLSAVSGVNSNANYAVTDAKPSNFPRAGGSVGARRTSVKRSCRQQISSTKNARAPQRLFYGEGSKSCSVASYSSSVDTTRVPLTTNKARKVEMMELDSMMPQTIFNSCSDAAREMGINRTKLSRTCLAGGGIINTHYFRYFEHCSAETTMASSVTTPHRTQTSIDTIRSTYEPNLPFEVICNNIHPDMLHPSTPPLCASYCPTYQSTPSLQPFTLGIVTPTSEDGPKVLACPPSPLPSLMHPSLFSWS